MAKKSGIGLLILGGVAAVGLLWLLTRKSAEQIECERTGGVWIPETKTCHPAAFMPPALPPQIGIDLPQYYVPR